MFHAVIIGKKDTLISVGLVKYIINFICLAACGPRRLEVLGDMHS